MLTHLLLALQFPNGFGYKTGVGHYVGLRFTAKLKPEFIDVVALLLEVGRSTLTAWKYVALASTDERHAFLLPWSEQDRAGHIPFGNAQSASYAWESTNTLEEDTWTVCCALKNEHTLEYFLTKVLPNMALEVPFCETITEGGHPEHPHDDGHPKTRIADPALLALAEALRQVEQVES